MAFHQQIAEILNRPIPLPAVLEAPIHLPRLISEEDVFEMEKRFNQLFSWLSTAGTRPSPARKAARLFSLEGTIKELKTGGFCIDGTPFNVNEDTFVIGILKTDAGAKVKGLEMPDGRRVATAIVMKECATA